MQNCHPRTPAKSCFVVVLCTTAVLLFLAGFVMGEDAGGARSDFYRYHLPIIYSFRLEPWTVAVRDYPSATGPLFHILESFNPLLGHDIAFRTWNVLTALGIVVLFVLALKLRFRSIAHNTMCPWLVGACLLFSPYFRASSYWPTTDNLSLLFTVLVCLLLHPYLDGEKTAESRERTALRIALIAVFGMCAFYTRQLYLWLPAFSYAILMAEAEGYRLWTTAAFIVTGLPALYLFHVWKGFAPPTFQHHHQALAPESLIVVCAMIAFYALPFFVEALAGGRRIFPPAGGNAKVWWSGAVVLCLGFAAMSRWFPFELYAYAGGISDRVFGHLGRLGPVLFLLVASAGLILLLVFLRESGWKSRLLIALFLLPNLVNKVGFERYFDPVILMTFFLFFERSIVARFSTVRAAVSLMVFYAALLGGSILYHGGDRRPFHPMYAHEKPWAGLPPAQKW